MGVRQVCGEVRENSRRPLPASTTSSLALGADGLNKIIENIDILTLDVFDTILARRAVDPTDVFRWIETAEGWTGFASARISAEADARRRHAARGQEVSLEEIYEVLELTMSLPPNALSKELKAESRFLYSNPAITDLISRARSAGRPVIAISDIYLSSVQVNSLLKASGVTVDKVYASADFRNSNMGKYNGKLFSHMLATECVLAEKVLHVGDNLVSDIANGQAAGLCVLETQQLHRLHCKSDPNAAALRPFVGSTSGSLVLGQYIKWLTHSAELLSPIETFGYAYGGPIIVGFVQYLVTQAKKQGISRFLLLERDGLIIEAAFKALGITEVTYRSVPASRRMMVFPALVNSDLRRIESLFEGHQSITERSFFEILALTPNDFVPDNKEALPFFEHFYRHESFLRAVARQEKSLILDFFAEEEAIIAEGKKVAWVDVGWALTSITALNEILGHDIPAFCIGSHNRTSAGLPHEGYLFTRSQPTEVVEAVLGGVEPIELIFSATSHSTVCLKKKDGLLVPLQRAKSPAEIIRDGYVAEIWRGALAFIKEFSDLLPGVKMEDLRSYNKTALAALCKSPMNLQYDILAEIPHDRLVGGTIWHKIRDFWTPSLCSWGAIPRKTAENTDLMLMLQIARRRPHKLLKDLLAYRFLRVIIKLSPFLPISMANRFARSAAKRDPRRRES